MVAIYLLKKIKTKGGFLPLLWAPDPLVKLAFMEQHLELTVDRKIECAYRSSPPVISLLNSSQVVFKCSHDKESFSTVKMKKTSI